MKNLKTGLVIGLLVTVTNLFTPSLSSAAEYSFCPLVSELHGWWGSITPSNRLCSTDYYTWNTISGVGGQESYYLSQPHYQLCNYSSVSNPGNITAEVYIPAPDYQQSQQAAHYYKWLNGSTYTLIGSVPQYYITGYALLSTVDWSQYDGLALSDWTNDSTKYAKHIDLDSFKLECYFN